MVAPSRKHSQAAFSRLWEIYAKWPSDRPQFDIRTGWARNYTQILSRENLQIISEEKILDTVLKKGRAIVTGRGGDGKTWLLRRLYKRILDRDWVPILLDLKQWSGGDYETWKDWTSRDIGDAAEFLISRFSSLGISSIDIDLLSPAIPKVLLVDGLNEITSDVGAQILSALDELVRIQMNLSIIATDRLKRRDLPSPTRWSLGVMLPLTPEEVSKHLQTGVAIEPDDIRTSPFFLDAELNFNISASKRSQTNERYFTSHSGLRQDELNKAAHAAYDAYRHSRSRVFMRDKFAQLASNSTTSALEKSGALISNPEGQSYFVHHMLHDYLAARFFAQQSVEQWTPLELSCLSFDGSSFDGVELAFEQVGTDRADVFLRHLYDWNLYAAGYALAQSRDAEVLAGTAMRTVILAMLAEKRFDTILATRQKADDALSLMQLSDAKLFRMAQSLDEVFKILPCVSSADDWFQSWKQLFVTRMNDRLSRRLLASLWGQDSIIGWTVANVAKRSILPDDSLSTLITQAETSDNSTTRWRIAHVLGAHPDEKSVEALFRLLDRDPDGNVRYGAIRSIIELAARGDVSTRSAVSDGVGARANAISEEPKIAGELRTCLLVDKALAPAGWLSFVSNVVRSMFLAIEDDKQRDLWRRCLNDAETLYGGQ